MIPKAIVHLDSGGMDSTVLKYWLQAEGHKVHSAMFNYGQTHIRELQFAKKHSERLGLLFTEIKLPQFRGSTLTDGSGGVVVPGRNGIFLMHAANLAVAAGADTLTIGCNKEDEADFPDCRMAFIQTFNNMLTTANLPVQVWAPFTDKSKSWIAALGQELGVNMDETYSCYTGAMVPCGECPACKKREAAFA